MEDKPLNTAAPDSNTHITSDTLKQMDRLIRLINTLRGTNGCPWDKKQTPRSMSIYLVEEVYELIEAIESEALDDICEELGDVLFHILFITSIFKEMGQFGIKRVADKISEKMIRRHPHVFGNKDTENIDDIKNEWRRIKKNEKKDVPKDSILDSVPSGLPALMRAFRISERAAGTGFDWNDIAEVIEKVEEELAEFKHAIHLKNINDASMEFGDIIFTLVNVARFAGFHPETALSDSTKKFEKRFRYMEKHLADNGKVLEKISREEMDRLWGKAKKKT